MGAKHPAIVKDERESVYEGVESTCGICGKSFGRYIPFFAVCSECKEAIQFAKNIMHRHKAKDDKNEART